MRTDKDRASVLRQSGLSYSEIKEKLGVPRSTLSNWFRAEKWSNSIAMDVARRHAKQGAIRLAVLNTVRGNRLKILYKDADQDAFADFLDIRFHPLFMAGVVLYYAHGDKTDKNRFLLSSSDPAVINITKKFLEDVCQMEKIKTWLVIDPKMPESMCKKYWVSKCGLKYEQFGKSRIVRHKKYHGRIHYGICNMSVSSAYLKRKILKWIELLVRELVSGTYLKAGIV